LLIEMFVIEQLSLDPLFTSVASTVALPNIQSLAHVLRHATGPSCR